MRFAEGQNRLLTGLGGECIGSGAVYCMPLQGKGIMYGHGFYSTCIHPQQLVEEVYRHCTVCWGIYAGGLLLCRAYMYI